MSVAAVDQRWDGFLTQIRGRFEEIMQESIAGCMALFEQTGETLALGNAWTGMRLRGMQLSTKVQDTWDEKVSDAYDDADATPAQEEAARKRGEDLQDHIEVELERVETKIYCDIARVLQARANQEHEQGMRCTQCGAGLDAGFVIRSTNVTCAACGAVNTIEPGSNARAIEGMAHYLCREAAWPQWVAMHEAERAYHDARTATLELLQAFEARTIDYWTAFLKHRAQLIPDRAKDFDADLRGKVHPLYITIKQERAWIDAGRPRRVPPPAGVKA